MMDNIETNVLQFKTPDVTTATAVQGESPNSRSRKEFADSICTAWGKSAASFIEASKHLAEAKEELPRDEFKALTKSLPFDASVARRLLCIAANSVLICAPAHKLPPGWSILYELSKLPAEILKARLADGSIHSGMGRKEAIALRKPQAAESKQKDAGGAGQDAVRTELDSTGQIDQLPKAAGKDGKARPARKARSKDRAMLAAANRAEARSRAEEKRRQQQVSAEIPGRIQADENPTEVNTATDVAASAEERKALYATSDSDDLSDEGLDEAEDHLEDDAARVIHEVHRCLSCFLPDGLTGYLKILSPEQKRAVGILLGVRDASKAVATLAALVKECLAHDFYEPHTESYCERVAEIKALIGRDGPAKNTEVGSAEGELLEYWNLATADEQRAVLRHVGVGGVLESLKGDMDSLAELYNRVIGLQVALASPICVSKASKKLLTNLSGTFHWALAQNDPASGAQGLQIINGKLKANGRDPKDLCLAFAKKARR